MRHVELEALVPGMPPAEVFDAIVRFERYPELAPHVESTEVQRTVPEPTGRSAWTLHFRSGLLRWTEQEQFLRDQGRLVFEQTEGDFDSFTGVWVLTAEGQDTRLRFDADFDFGIPSLEGILDPIAERVIKETVGWVVVGMFDDAALVGAADLFPVGAGPAS
jgi:ribosome-associated toxin RatA of RatAB toxin-antitoxin module